MQCDCACDTHFNAACYILGIIDASTVRYSKDIYISCVYSLITFLL